MKHALVIVLLLCTFAIAADKTTAPEYFQYSRRVQISDHKLQNYFVVDLAMWENMRADLGDMRLYSQSQEVPYAPQIQRGGRSLLQQDTKLLDLGSRGDATEFKLQISAPEYDTVTLKLKTRDFTTLATVEGSDNGSDWRKLNTTPIFDFSREHLGCNFELRLPTLSRFQFVRVTIARDVPAKDVEGASVALLKDLDAAWLTIPAQPSISQSGRDTVVEWDSPKVPLDRVQLSVGEPALNFYRPAELFDADGHAVASTELARVHMRRNGRTLDHENLGLDIPYDSRSKHYKLVIHNSDDRPLPITQVLPRSYERRAYFEPQSRTDFTLYFGDPKTEVPMYDYSRLFQKDPAAIRANLEPSQANPTYTGRPDDRPWSERNKWLLWVVLIVAVLGLGAIAVRSMTKVAA